MGVTDFVREFKEMLAIERLAFIIYQEKVDAVAKAGVLRMRGLFGPDPLAEEAWEEATALVRGSLSAARKYNTLELYT